MESISVLLPTRGRYEMLTKSVNSLIENCNDLSKIEILLAVDTDDKDTTDRIIEYISDKPNIKMFFYERQHYKGLHLYITDLAKNASGSSLLVWNDDAIMQSKDWDVEILKAHKSFCVLSPKVGNMEDYWKHKGLLFPIIPKKWIEITGFWSPTPGVDSWVDVLSKKLNILVNLESVVIFHDRYELTGQNHDNTYVEVRMDKDNTSLHKSYEVWSYPEMLNDHYNKLLQYINESK